MIITDLEVIALSCKLQEPFGVTMNWWLTEKSNTIVRVRTDEDITGIGECAGPPKVIASIINYILKPLILGREPFNIEKIWSDMYSATYLFGRKGVVLQAMSGIDIALWDIIGKACKLPLYKLLGGYRNEVQVYAMVGYYKKADGLEGLVKTMIHWASKGFDSLKMKVGGLSIDEEIGRVRAVREAIGDDVKLMVDANGQWNLMQAMKFVKKAERYDIYWLEEPVPIHNVRGLSELVALRAMPIATGENEYTRYGFKNLIENDAVDILQTDATKTGGITEWKKICSMASAYDIPMAPHNGHVVHMHLVASAPNGMTVEVHPDPVRDPFYEELFHPYLEARQGRFKLPSSPGLGVQISEETVSKYRIPISSP